VVRFSQSPRGAEVDVEVDVVAGESIEFCATASLHFSLHTDGQNFLTFLFFRKESFFLHRFFGLFATHPLQSLLSLFSYKYVVRFSQSPRGAKAGEVVGESVGESLGESVGNAVGEVVGELLGESLGESVGNAVGEVVGASLGESLGKSVGNTVGEAVVESVGELLDKAVGEVLGGSIGKSVGDTEGDIVAVDGKSVGT